MKKSYWLYLVLMLFSISSCKKDEVEVICNTSDPVYYCGYEISSFDYVTDPMEIGVNYEYIGDYQYWDPKFNPNNQFEILFNRNNDQGEKFYKFNFCTGELTLLRDGNVDRYMWAEDGFVIYSIGNDFYKISDEGGNPEFLYTPSEYTYLGAYNPSKTKYFDYWTEYDYPYDSYFSIRNSSNAIELQVYNFNSSFYHVKGWLNDSLLFGVRNDKLYSFNVLSNEYQVLSNSSVNSEYSGFYFDELNNSIYEMSSSLLKYNLNVNNSVEIVRDFYDGYRCFKGGLIEDKIISIASRYHYGGENNETLYRRNDIVLMNLDGSEERIVEFEE